MAIIRSAMYGVVFPRLAIGATRTTAFSSQSVMTLALAEAGMVTPSDAQIKAAGILRYIDARMVFSVCELYGVQFRSFAQARGKLPKCGQRPLTLTEERY